MWISAFRFLSIFRLLLLSTGKPLFCEARAKKEQISKKYANSLVAAAKLFNAPVPTATLPLALLVQPQDLILAPGDKARFLARANALNLTYQWYKGTLP